MKPKQISAASDDRYIVPAVEQASRVLFCLARSESAYMSLSEITGQVGIHKSKAFSILTTLQKFGLVQKNTAGSGYSLGPGLIGLYRRFLDNLRAPALAEPILEDLARETGATAILGLIADKNVYVAAKHEGGGPVSVTMRVGQRLALTYGSHGKAIAAFLPKDELDKLLKEKKLYFYGETARFDKASLMKEIDRTRKEWYAVDIGETAEGLNTAAAPVLGPNGYPIGYIVVLGLASEEATHKCGPLVAEAGKVLSRQLGATV
jgi:DNA-binding IclR family transcriptional regulator